jgi:hypothetical protein
MKATIITKQEYDKLHEDYKGIYSSDDIHGTKLNGKRTLVKWLENIGTVLLIEGESFEFVESEDQEIEPRKCDICKSGMSEGFYQDGLLDKPNYYCSSECLHTEFKEGEWCNLHNESPEYFYWTQFETDLEE